MILGFLGTPNRLSGLMGSILVDLEWSLSIHWVGRSRDRRVRWSRALRVAPKVILTSEERSELARIVASRLSSVRLSQRAQIVLLAAGSLQNKEIADRLGVDRMQVARWRQRYLQKP